MVLPCPGCSRHPLPAVGGNGNSLTLRCAPPGMQSCAPLAPPPPLPPHPTTPLPPPPLREHRRGLRSRRRQRAAGQGRPPLSRAQGTVRRKISLLPRPPSLRSFEAQCRCLSKSRCAELPSRQHALESRYACLSPGAGFMQSFIALVTPIAVRRHHAGRRAPVGEPCGEARRRAARQIRTGAANRHAVRGLDRQRIWARPLSARPIVLVEFVAALGGGGWVRAGLCASCGLVYRGVVGGEAEVLCDLGTARRGGEAGGRWTGSRWRRFVCVSYGFGGFSLLFGEWHARSKQRGDRATTTKGVGLQRAVDECSSAF